VAEAAEAEVEVAVEEEAAAEAEAVEVAAAGAEAVEVAEAEAEAEAKMPSRSFAARPAGRSRRSGAPRSTQTSPPSDRRRTVRTPSPRL